MAVSRGTSWVDDTEVVASSVGARLNAVMVDLPLDAAAETFIQLWDNANPDPGTTTPRMVLPVPRNAVAGTKRRRKFVFPGGLEFTTALSWLPTTTYNGQTVPTGADKPLAVSVFYETLTG